MNTTSSEYISLIELGMAYRKAKVDLYYMGNPCLQRILNYEENLFENLRNLHIKLSQFCDEDKTWKQEPGFLGDWTLIPKSIDQQDKPKNNLIFSDPNKHWEYLSDGRDKPIAEFRLMAEPNIDFCVISTLWIAKVGCKYEEKLNGCACGNRLRRKKDGKVNALSLGSFTPYLKPFRDWRDKGISVMKNELDNAKSIVAITADVQSFYHELNPSFMLSDDFLNSIGLKLENKERKLTELFIQALEAWAKDTPLQKGLPVGLPASALVANMSLIELDDFFQKEITPLYYGRYVDDILLVMENGSDFKSEKEVWDWIFARSNKLLKWKDDEKNAIVFSPSYLNNSTIQFSSDKNKIFLLKGDTGIALIDALARQIHQRASEWRALPNLSSNPKHIATDLLSATQPDGEAADNLRKTDFLSMRRSDFAIKLRDFEAYDRDLPPETWQAQRSAFLKAFVQHTLVLPTFFDLFNYLPRIIRLATACEDFAELKNIIEQIYILVESVENNCDTKIKSCDNDALVTNGVVEIWKKQLHKIIEENVKAAFPPRLTKEGKKLWQECFTNTELLRFNLNIKDIQQSQQRFFSHDLAHIPFRFIGLPAEFTNKRGIPPKKGINYCSEAKLLVESTVVEGLKLISRHINSQKFQAIPYGLLFSTRPFSLTELYLLQSNPYTASTEREIMDSILALRGFSVTGKMPCISKDQIFEVPVSRDINNLRIAVASWKTSSDSWTASVTKNTDPDLTRYQRLTQLLNEILHSGANPDYLIFPELSVPSRWFIGIAKKLQGKGISLVSGIEYLHRAKGKVSNQVWMALSHDSLGFPAMMIYRQDKQRPALHEERELQQLAALSMSPSHPWKGQKPPIIRHGKFQFAILICSELTNISYRTALRGQVDALFVPEWNQDTETFNALVESAALDIHAYIIQCNDRQYGDSRIRAPYKDSWKRDIVRIKGGLSDYFVVGEIEITALRQFQSSYRSPDTPFKPVPDGFTISYERKLLPKL